MIKIKIELNKEELTDLIISLENNANTKNQIDLLNKLNNILNASDLYTQFINDIKSEKPIIIVRDRRKHIRKLNKIFKKFNLKWESGKNFNRSRCKYYNYYFLEQSVKYKRYCIYYGEEKEFNKFKTKYKVYYAYELFE